MIVHNITTKVLWVASEEWIRWQQETCFPKLLATGLCEDCRIFHLLDQDETEGPTYTIQLFFNKQESYDAFLLEINPGLVRDADQRWRGVSVHFSTAMQLVN